MLVSICLHHSKPFQAIASRGAVRCDVGATWRGFSSKNKPADEASKLAPKLAFVTAAVATAGGLYMLYNKVNYSWYPVKPQAEVTSKCFLDIEIEGHHAGRIVIGMYGKVVPKTVKNFETLCEGSKTIDGKTLSLTGTYFHRIIPTFLIQGGDIDGKGGRSIYDSVTFEDENFTCKFTGPGVVGMVNEELPNNTGSQFFIVTGRASYLDGKHVAFGTVLEGWDVVKIIESCGTLSRPSQQGLPLRKVRVVKAGILDQE